MWDLYVYVKMMIVNFKGLNIIEYVILLKVFLVLELNSDFLYCYS